MLEKFEYEIRISERIERAVDGLIEGLPMQIVQKINLLTDEQMAQAKQIYETKNQKTRGTKVEVIPDADLEQKYGNTIEYQALNELYYDSSLTREEKLELFDKLSPETIEKIPDERDELKRLLVASKIINNNKEFFNLSENGALSTKYDERLDFPVDHWVQLEPGESILDYYKKKRDEREEKRKKSKEQTEEFKRKLDEF